MLLIVTVSYPDPPIKRFAQRYLYLGTDAIAERDVGTAYIRRDKQQQQQQQQAGGGAATLVKTETSQSLTVIGNNNNNANNNAGKRPASPDHSRPKREDNTRNFDQGGGGYKRQRGNAGNASPTRGDRDVHMRDRERDDRRDRGDGRWGENRNRRFSPPPTGWDRDKDKDDRDGGRGYGGGGGGRDLKRDESFGRGGPVQIPSVVSYFIGELPPASSFDGAWTCCVVSLISKAELGFCLAGPVFKTEDLMKCFKQAIIPPSTGGPANGPGPSRVRSPPPSGPNYGQHRGMRSPIDFSSLNVVEHFAFLSQVVVVPLRIMDHTKDLGVEEVEVEGVVGGGIEQSVHSL